MRAPGCTIAAIRENGRYLLASNSDNPWDTRTRVRYIQGKFLKFLGTELVCPDDSLPWSNMVTRGINERGIDFTFSYVDCCPEFYQGGIGLKEFGHHILGSFQSLKEIEDYLRRGPVRVHGNFLFADALGNLLISEIHPAEKYFEWNPATAIIRTNHFINLPFVNEKEIGETCSTLRYQSGMYVLNRDDWELCGRLKLIDPFMFSWPSSIVVKAWEFFLSGEVFKHLAVSAMEVGFGFAMALIGIPIGLMMGYWKKLELAFDPFVTALYTTPMIALTPLFVLWFGLDTLSKVMMVFALSIFPILINMMAGVKMTDPSLIKAARSYGASEFQMFKEVIFPSAIPFMITGIRLAIGRALIAVVVAEMLAGNIGIGFAIRHASELFQTAEYLGRP